MKRRLSVLLALLLAVSMLFSSCGLGDIDSSDDTASSGNTDSGNTDNGNTDSGNTDSGNTDSGNTDSGNTDSGNTDDGNTDSGNTDDGNTDDGTTDDGNTDSGNTDDGNTDSGNTEDGNTDDGTTDDGNTDDGNTDDGTTDEEITVEKPALTKPSFDLSAIPEYDGSRDYVEVNGNVPTFTANQYTGEAYEYYSELDQLGRCRIAVAVIGKELMPDGSHGSISYDPTGWTGGEIFERCHLIAFALAGEKSNEKNLITGTLDLNDVMQQFERYVIDYIKETSNHVLYRVEPIFEGENLLASGVHMEAYSIEDDGEGIFFNIYIYNSQADCDIDYATGNFEHVSECRYVLNTNSKKIHRPDCRYAHSTSEENKQETDKTIAELEKEGYTICKTCKPSDDEN